MPAPTKAGAKAPAPMVVLAISQEWAVELQRLLYGAAAENTTAHGIVHEIQTQLDRHSRPIPKQEQTT